jgi:hypothetical protein
MPRKREYKREHAPRWVDVGTRVRFDPFHYIQSFGESEHKCGKVVGTVVYVNRPRKWFLVEYGNNLRTCFKFYEVGLAVMLVG